MAIYICSCERGSGDSPADSCSQSGNKCRGDDPMARPPASPRFDCLLAAACCTAAGPAQRDTDIVTRRISNSGSNSISFSISSRFLLLCPFVLQGQAACKQAAAEVARVNQQQVAGSFALSRFSANPTACFLVLGRCYCIIRIDSLVDSSLGCSCDPATNPRSNGRITSAQGNLKE